MNLTAAITGLVGITVITSFCADNRALPHPSASQTDGCNSCWRH